MVLHIPPRCLQIASLPSSLVRPSSSSTKKWVSNNKGLVVPPLLGSSYCWRAAAAAACAALRAAVLARFASGVLGCWATRDARWRGRGQTQALVRRSPAGRVAGLGSARMRFFPGRARPVAPCFSPLVTKPLWTSGFSDHVVWATTPPPAWPRGSGRASSSCLCFCRSLARSPPGASLVAGQNQAAATLQAKTLALYATEYGPKICPALHSSKASYIEVPESKTKHINKGY
jgi:hypothetical protein